jgi:mannose-6-phosphate isomerase-like protein (cupin superfamily)
MSNYVIKRIDDMEAMYRGGMKRARAELGVTSFGIQVLDLPAGAGEYYPEHDHAGDGQEEVYLLLRGSGEIEIEGERHALDPDSLVRVGSGVRRRLWPGSDGMRVLALGGVPGQAYRISESTELGQPDPMAG